MKIFTLALLILCYKTQASIVLPNYNSNPIGERAGLQGGAFISRVNDASASWYNPAGLVKAQKSSISGNASAFAIAQGKKTDDDEGSTFVPIPSLIGNVGKIYPNLAWGFSVATPNNIKISNKVESTRNSVSLSTDNYQYIERNDGLYSLTTPGLSLATSLSKDFRIGFGVRYYMFSIRNQRNILYINNDPSNGLPFSVTDIFDLNLTSDSIRFNIGFQHDLDDNWSWGMLLRSPNLIVSSKGEQFQIQTKLIQSGDERIDRQLTKDIEVNYKLPYEVSTGISYTGRKWEFEANVRYYGAVSETNLLDFQLTQEGLVTTNNGAFVKLSNTFNAQVKYEFEPVINYSVGIGRKISKDLIAQIGAFTDKSPVKNQSSSVPFSHIDLIGFTTGISKFTHNSSTSIGVMYLSGDQEGVLREDRTASTFTADNIKQSMTIIGLMLSGSYYF